MAEDYYSTLGVARGASAEDIRKAYRDLARKYHPDLNPDNPQAKENFQRVQAAFDVLNDPKKKEMYDRYGSAYETMGAGPGGGKTWTGGGPTGPGGFDVNLEDMFAGGGFADLFRQFGQRKTGGRRSQSVRGTDLEHELTVPFNTSILGGEAQISVRRSDGRTDDLRVKIPAGIEDGKKIRLRGQGEPGAAGGPPGDILIRVRSTPHPYFRRTGHRLDVTVPITLEEAVRGAKVDVPTPHGTITLAVPPGSSSGRKLRVKGHGIRPAHGPAGDLFAELQIVLPQAMNEADREQIADIARKYAENPRTDLKW